MNSKSARTDKLAALRWHASMFLMGVLLLIVFTDTAQAPPTGLPALLRELTERVEALEGLLASVSLNDDGDLVISGANLLIQSGGGATDAPITGKGNLIVGYDEDNGDEKSGSHNLIIGAFHSYSSYGGLVAGEDNNILAPSASVSGGFGNDASGDFSSVSGGESNTASGNHSSVSGGLINTASGNHSSVSGGRENVAESSTSSVSGGRLNTASGFHSSISGGNFNEASGASSSVGG
ncbi:MAG: hypothetical protein ACYSU7_18895, partial [Planctomycetota bacterium]